MKEDQKIVIYQTPDGKTQIDVRLENETVWLTQTQMAQLFKSSRTNVLEHIQHIYEVEELEKEATCRNFRQVRQEGKRMVNRTKAQDTEVPDPLCLTPSCYGLFWICWPFPFGDVLKLTLNDLPPEL